MSLKNSCSVIHIYLNKCPNVSFCELACVRAGCLLFVGWLWWSRKTLFCGDASSKDECETVVTHTSWRNNSLPGRHTLDFVCSSSLCVLKLGQFSTLSKWSFKGDWRTAGQDQWPSLQCRYFEYHHFSRRITSVFLLKPQFSHPVQSH